MAFHLLVGGEKVDVTLSLLRNSRLPVEVSRNFRRQKAWNLWNANKNLDHGWRRKECAAAFHEYFPAIALVQGPNAAEY